MVRVRFVGGSESSGAASTEVLSVLLDPSAASEASGADVPALSPAARDADVLKDDEACRGS